MGEGVTLYDRTSGKAQDFDPKEAAAAVNAGTHAAQAVAKIPILSPDGKLGTVPGSDLGQAIAAGARLATNKEWEEGQAQARVDAKGHLGPENLIGLNLPGQVQAWQAAALSGATAGLGPAAIKSTIDSFSPSAGARYGQDQLDLDKAYPKTSTAGKVAGTIAGVALGGAAGAAGKLLPAAGLDALGTGVEQGLGQAVSSGLGNGALARGVGSTVGMAARGGIEAGGYGMADELSEQVLGSAPLNAEKIYASGIKTGLAGAVVGGALGAGGALARGAGEGLGVVSPSMSEEFAPKIQKEADKQLWHSLTTNNNRAEALARRAGGPEAISATLRETGVAPTTVMEAAKFGTPEGMIPRIEATKERIAKQLSEVRTATPATVNMGDLAKSIDRAMVDESGVSITKSAIHQDVVASLQKYKFDLADSLGAVKEEVGKNGQILRTINHEAEVPFLDVLQQRKFLDQKIYGEAKQLDPAMRVEYLRNARHEMETTAIDAIDKAAKDAGNDGVGEELRRLAKQYSHLSIAGDAAETQAGRMSGHTTFGINSVIAGAGAVASGHPIGGMVTTAAWKVAKERGNAVASVMLDKIANLGAIQRTVSKVDDQVGRSVAGLLAEKAPSKASRGAQVATLATAPIARRYQDAIKQTTAIQNEASMMAHATDRAGTVGQHAPDTAASYATTLTKAAAYLISKIPISPAPQLGTLKALARVPDAQAASFLRTFEAVKKPISVLKEWERGKITREGVEALKATAPELYQQLKTRALEAITAHGAKGKSIPYETRLKFGILFDSDTDPSLVKKTMQALQSNVADAIDKDPSSTGPAPSSSVKMPTQTSAYDRIEQKG